MTSSNNDRRDAEAAFVEDLNELWEEYKETYPEFTLELATSSLNYSIRSILFQTDPMIMSETVCASLSAWLSFSRQLVEEEEEPEVTTQRVQVISREDTMPDPELLFMDVTDKKPN